MNSNLYFSLIYRMRQQAPWGFLGGGIGRKNSSSGRVLGREPSQVSSLFHTRTSNTLSTFSPVLALQSGSAAHEREPRHVEGSSEGGGQLVGLLE